MFLLWPPVTFERPRRVRTRSSDVMFDSPFTARRSSRRAFGIYCTKLGSNTDPLRGLRLLAAGRFKMTKARKWELIRREVRAPRIPWELDVRRGLGVLAVFAAKKPQWKTVTRIPAPLTPLIGLLEFGLCTNVCDQDAGYLPLTRRVNLLQTGVLVKWSRAEFASLSPCGAAHVDSAREVVYLVFQSDLFIFLLGFPPFSI
jgi:hypothetical protein